MIEELAVRYVGLPPFQMICIALMVTVIGAGFAISLNRSQSALLRAPYFAISALITFLVVAAQSQWLLSLSAITNAYLWVLVAISFALTLFSGILHGLLGAARARDAFGNRWMAFLIFVPFGALWLLFAPSMKVEEPTERKPPFPLFRGALGILSGIVLYAASAGAFVFIQQAQLSIAEGAGSNPAAQQASIDFLIQTQGLEYVLGLLAADVQTPITIDEVTTLTRVEASGVSLTRTYTVATELQFTKTFTSMIETSVCGYPPFAPLLDAGATIHEAYFAADGSLLGEALVSAASCGRTEDT